MRGRWTRPATAALVLVAAGAALAALYAGGGPTGNGTAAACAVASERAAKLAPLVGGEVAAVQVADAPESMADLAFTGSDGQPRTVGDSKGRVTLVNLWATWCAPCRAEMPSLSRLEAEKGGDRFRVLPINLDREGREKAERFLAEIGVSNLPLATDPTMASFQTLQKQGLTRGLPVTLLVDGEGCRLAHINGPAEWDSPEAMALIEAALGT